jgi:molecular chaperone DnaJ
MAAVLFLPANPNPPPSTTPSLRTPRPCTSGELHFRPRLVPCRARARTLLPAAFGRDSPAAAAAAAERGGKDYYATLNIRRDATLKEVKSAYRTLARKVPLSSFVSHAPLGLSVCLLLLFCYIQSSLPVSNNMSVN